MGRLYIRLPASKNRPEHWQVISTNLDGPPAAGQLKLRDYSGWYRHVPQGIVGADLLKLRHRKGDGWHNVLYMSNLGSVAKEQWWVVDDDYRDKERIPFDPDLPPNGVPDIGTKFLAGAPLAMRLTQTYVNPQVVPFYEDQFGNRHQISYDAEAFWQAIEYQTFPPQRFHSRPANWNLGSRNDNNRSEDNVIGNGRAFANSLAYIGGTLGGGTEVFGHGWYPNGYYPYGTRMTQYTRAVFTVDLKFIRERTNVPADEINGIAITFKGRIACTVIDETTDPVTTAGKIPGYTVGATSLLYASINDLGDTLHTYQQPVNRLGEPTENRLVQDKVITAYVAKPHLDYIIGGYPQLLEPYTYRGMFFTEGTSIADMQPTQIIANRYGLEKDVQMFGTPFTRTVTLENYEFTTTDVKSYSLTTPLFGDVIVPAPTADKNPPSLAFGVLLDEVSLSILGQDD